MSTTNSDVPDVSSLRDAYVDLLKRAVLGTTVGPVEALFGPVQPKHGRFRNRLLGRLMRPYGAVMARRVPVDLNANLEGTESVWTLPQWPMTMIGSVRLDNVRDCVIDVIERGVPGDLIETGVWRGGTTIFMRGVLRAYGSTDRSVYVADSFAGLPAPDVDRYPDDAGLDLHLWPGLVVGLDEVRANFERYGLLDDQVVFVKGWFSETLPTLRDRTWAVLRLDGDMYESTTDSLENLYPGLSPGGWLIIDDHEIPACARAVADFRERHGITEPITTIDWTGICWQKGS